MNAAVLKFVSSGEMSGAAIARALELLPIVLSGQGTKKEMDAALALWEALDDRARVNYCDVAFSHAREGRVAVAVWSKILSAAWRRGRGGSMLLRAGKFYNEIAQMFELAHPVHLMNGIEYQTFKGLPDPVTVYRPVSGTTVIKARNAMSWTGERACAVSIAAVEAPTAEQPLLLRGSVSRRDILAFFARDAEIVVRSRSVFAVETLFASGAEWPPWPAEN